jgi:dihydroorotate dehydrogenase electron transfer subunit
MNQVIFTIKSQKKIAEDVMLAVLSGDTSDIKASGQFVNIKLDGFFLRRPISVCDYDQETLTLIYKIVGEGTAEMSRYKEGTKLDVLTGLGNGYDTSKSGNTPLLIGGGVGVPPMYNLCKVLSSEGKKPSVIIGFNTKDEVF